MITNILLLLILLLLVQINTNINKISRNFIDKKNKDKIQLFEKLDEMMDVQEGFDPEEDLKNSPIINRFRELHKR